jgi:hypothetical protein
MSAGEQACISASPAELLPARLRRPGGTGADRPAGLVAGRARHNAEAQGGAPIPLGDPARRSRRGHGCGGFLRSALRVLCQRLKVESSPLRLPVAIQVRSASRVGPSPPLMRAATLQAPPLASRTTTSGNSMKRSRSALTTSRSRARAVAAMIRSCAPRGVPARRVWASSAPWARATSRS